MTRRRTAPERREAGDRQESWLFRRQLARASGIARENAVSEIAVDQRVGPLLDPAEARAAAHEHLDHVTLGEVDGGLAAQLLDRAVGAQHAAVASLAGLAAQEAL